MVCLKKKLVLTLTILLIVLGVLLVVEPCVAPVTVSDNPEAAPEIVSVKIHSNHQYYPPTYSTNPYTGETTLTNYARYYPNGTIEITIKNRPFTPYIDKNGHTINRYYTFFTRREEAYFSWKDQLSAGPWYVVYQSNTDYTVISTTYFPDIAPSPHIGIMYEGEVQSFRVQAVTGYFINNGDSRDPNAVYEGVGSDPVFF